MRRLFSGVLVAVSLACAHNAGDSLGQPYPWWTGRLRVRPVRVSVAPSSYQPGLRPLHDSLPNDAWIDVPSLATTKAVPLVVLLHGAGGSAARIIRNYEKIAEETGMIVVAPKSRGATWDVIGGYYGPDVQNVDSVIAEVTHAYSVDPNRIFLVGFSDGASYALGLGRLNGDIFSKIVAFSPGVLLPVTPRGSPLIFISHGTRDEILPIDRASRMIVPALRDQGFRVEYREFDGPHTAPPDIVAAAMHWLTKG